MQLGIGATVHPTALIEDGVVIGARTSIWDNVHIRRSARIGEECIIGEKTYIAYGVSIGNRVKINAFVYVCTGVTILDGAMVSAGTVFTNDRFPRATTADLKTLRPSEPDAHTRPTLVKEGATIGAGSTVGNDLTIGRFAMIGMGSVVTKSVPDFNLAFGNPARPVGSVCRCGELLVRFEAEPSAHRRWGWGPSERAVKHNREQEVACSACGLPYRIRHQTVEELAPPA